MNDTTETTGEAKPPALITRRLLVHGRVQGVSYRASMEAEAQRLGLAGWVRNLRSGDVEALVSGPEDAVEAMIDWARQGPPAAKVDFIEISAEEAPTEPGFRVLPTA